ncbi:MAG: 3'(2'),5'-bisphosphate nucleotidase CysQ family protein [Oleiphilus sp.]
MSFSELQLRDLCLVAETAAKAAGKLINSYHQREVVVQTKQGGNTKASQVVTEVDLACQSLILSHLAASVEQYDLAVLSEELEDDRQRLRKQAFWCIDPLDGTLAFTESKPGYAVSIALVSQSGTPQIGVIYDPVNQVLYSAIRGLGAKRNGRHWRLPDTNDSQTLSLPLDRSLLQRCDFTHIRQTLMDSVKQKGMRYLNEIHHAGAVMNACWALETPPACYFKLPKKQQGGGSFWDFAATACIYHEMGALCCDFEGKELDLNRPDTTFMNQSGVIFSTEPDWVELIRALNSRQ